MLDPKYWYHSVGCFWQQRCQVEKVMRCCNSRDGILSQEHDSSSTSRRWREGLLGRLWKKQPISQPGATQRNILGSGFGTGQALVFWIHKERRSPSVPLLAPLTVSFSPHTVSTTPLAIKERRWRLMRELKPFSFPSPCKPTPVHPSCVHSAGFDWNLSFTWWEELTWMANLGVHR